MMRALSGSQATVAASEPQAGQQYPAASEREAAGSGTRHAALEGSAGMPANEGIHSELDKSGCHGNEIGTQLAGGVDEEDEFGGFVQ